jgi:glycosyltransferase involved in cell wall biosynthesis
MNILIVHQYYLHKDDAGGSRWNQFAKYWSEQGHHITVLSGMVHYATGKKHPEYKGKFLVTEHEGPNITVKRCHVSEAYNRSFAGRAWAYLSFTFSSTIAGLFVHKPDVIICTSPPLTVGITGAILSKLKRIPMVFEVRDLWPESAIDTGVLTNKWIIKLSYWMERVSYRSAKWINVLTPAFEEALIQRKGISKDRISMIPNAADLDLISPGPRENWVREKYHLQGKFVVTYVGAHGVANALMQLVEAAKLLKKQSSDVQILLVGEGMEKPKLIDAARSEGLDNITFVESVPKSQINDFLNASDVCTAVLKRCDTFKTVYPNKVFDYMAAAKPIIIGIDGVARKLIEEAGAGVYVESENPKAFVEAINTMKNNPQIRESYGSSGLKYVQENFSRQKLANDYINLLEELLS